MAEPRAQRARRRRSAEQLVTSITAVPLELWSNSIALGLSLPEIAALCRSNAQFNAEICRNQQFWREYLQTFLQVGKTSDFPPTLLAASPAGPIPVDAKDVVRILYRATTDLEHTIRFDAAPRAVFSQFELGMPRSWQAEVKEQEPVAMRFRYRFVPPVLPAHADPLGVPAVPAGVGVGGTNSVDFWLDMCVVFAEVQDYVDRHNGGGGGGFDITWLVLQLAGRRDHAQAKPAWWAQIQQIYDAYKFADMLQELTVSTTYVPQTPGLAVGLRLERMSDEDIGEIVFRFKQLLANFLLVFLANVPGGQVVRYDVPLFSTDVDDDALQADYGLPIRLDLALVTRISRL